ncbi:hypothetical protein C3K47_12005, partial [Solitalea longa]
MDKVTTKIKKRFSKFNFFVNQFSAVYFFILGLVVVNQPSYAQVCSGALGNPVVTIDFGYSQSGGNYGQSLPIMYPQTTTTYTYWYPTTIPAPSNYPNDLHDGKYGILPRLNPTISHADGAWHTYQNDHTFELNGKPNGNMYVVNADLQKGIFYQQEIDQLCPGSTYEFSAWFSNILKSSSCGGNGIRPNIKFQIEDTKGTILGSYTSGNIPSTSNNPTWTQRGFLFTIPPNSSTIVLKMISNTNGGCGNDLAIDDITFRACGPTITMEPSNDKTICEGDQFEFWASLGTGYADPYYVWEKSTDGGITWEDFSQPRTDNRLTFTNALVSNSGYYRVRVGGGLTAVNNPKCYVVSTPVKLSVKPGPTIDVNGAGTLCIGEEVTLTAYPSGSIDYEWFKVGVKAPVKAKSSSNTYTFTATDIGQSGDYYVVAYNQKQQSENPDSFVECSVQSQPIKVSINPIPKLLVTDQIACGSADLTSPAVTNGSDAGTLSYFSDAAVKTPLANPSSITTSGTYYIKLTSAQSCSVIKPVTVTINTLPKLVITNPPATCDQPINLTNPAITAGSDAGTLSYFSDAAVKTPLANPSSITTSGTYYIQLTNAQGCSVINPVTVTINPLPKLVITNPTATCDQPVDLTNPAITAGSDLGSLSYFSDAAGTTTLANPSAITVSGTYYIQLTSAQGCSVIKPVTVTINPLPKLVITNPTATCDQPVDLTNPAITAGSDLGSLSYFSDAAGTTTLANPSAITVSGTYYIQLTSAQGCSVIKPVTVTINPLPKLVITNPTATCDQPVDLTNPAITAGSDLGSLSYFSDAVATMPLTNPSAITASGTYYIQLTSAQGCSVIKPVTVTINALPKLVITNPPATCTQPVDLTSTAITAGSELGNLSYFSDAVAKNPLANPSSISTNGTYYIQLTSAQGCSVIKPVTVTINALPKLVITNPQPTCDQPVDLTSTAITAGSDVGAFSYFSDAAATTSLANPSSVTASGTYYIKQTNAQGCSVIKPVSVTINPLPNLVITDPSATCNQPVDLTNATITAGSDAGSLSYFSDAAGTISLADPKAIMVSGTYYIKLTNAQGCSVIKPVTVTINALPKLVITNPSATCDQPINLTNPAITAGSDLGSLSYFSDAVATMPLTNPSAITVSGTYYIKLTSVQGCSVIKPVTVTINALPKLVITNPPATCTQPVDLTSIAITAGSELGNLSYFSDAVAKNPLANPSSISANGTYYIQLTSAQGCSVIKPVTVTINALPKLLITNPTATCDQPVDLTNPAITAGSELASLSYFSDATASTFLANPSSVTTSGTYYIQLTNTQGCSVIQPVTVTIHPLPNLVITNPTATCDQPVDLTYPAITAGSDLGSLSYFSDAVATMPLTNSSAITASGTYYIQLANAQGCSVIKPVSVTINPLPNLVITDPLATCDQPVDLTSATITAGSDLGSLSYFSDAAGTTTLANPSAITVSGTYYIQLTSAQDCSVIKSVTVTINPLPKLVITNPPATCDQPINLTNPAITAGSDTGTLSYFSDAAATTSLANPSSVTASGTYYIKQTNAQGCSVIKPVSVTINPLPNLVITDPSATCNQPVDLTNATITAGSDAGTLSYFSDAAATTSLANPSSVTASGTYYIKQTNAQGCSVIKPVTVTINPLPKLVITDPQATCDQPVDLTSATITAGSDLGSLSYFSDAAGTIPLANPSAITVSGTYYIQLTSAQGCSVIKPVTVTINALPKLVITDPLPTCAQPVDLTNATITAGSDAGTLSYFIDAAASTSLANPSSVTASGTYYIQLTSAQGCSMIQPVTVTIHPLPKLVITNPPATCAQPVDLTNSAITAD